MGRADQRAALIGLIYEAALDHKLWPSAIDRLTDLIGARVGQISTFDVYTRTSATIAPRISPEAISEYDTHWVHQNPRVERGKHVPTGCIFTGDDLIPRESFARTPIHNGFFAPRGLHESIGAKLVGDETGWAVLGLWRHDGAGPFNAVDSDLLASIVPHLQRALKLSQRLTALEMARDASAELLDRLPRAALLVDATCRVMFANRAAETILADEPALHRGADGILRGSRGAETVCLHRLAAGRGATDGQAVSGAAVRVSRGELRTPLIVMAVPLPVETNWLQPRRPVAILFVSDPERDEGADLSVLRRDYGLTPMEAAVAVRVLAGKGLKAAAARLGIAPTTARTHLTAVFDKTGTRRQADLVRLLLQSGAVIRER